jgi:hypothetical protein
MNVFELETPGREAQMRRIGKFAQAKPGGRRKALASLCLEVDMADAQIAAAVIEAAERTGLSAEQFMPVIRRYLKEEKDLRSEKDLEAGRDWQAPLGEDPIGDLRGLAASFGDPGLTAPVLAAYVLRVGGSLGLPTLEIGIYKESCSFSIVVDSPSGSGKSNADKLFRAAAKAFGGETLTVKTKEGLHQAIFRQNKKTLKLTTYNSEAADIFTSTKKDDKAVDVLQEMCKIIYGEELTQAEVVTRPPFRDENNMVFSVLPSVATIYFSGADLVKNCAAAVIQQGFLNRCFIASAGAQPALAPGLGLSDEELEGRVNMFDAARAAEVLSRIRARLEVCGLPDLRMPENLIAIYKAEARRAFAQVPPENLVKMKSALRHQARVFQRLIQAFAWLGGRLTRDEISRASDMWRPSFLRLAAAHAFAEESDPVRRVSAVAQKIRERIREGARCVPHSTVERWLRQSGLSLNELRTAKEALAEDFYHIVDDKTGRYAYFEKHDE